MLIVSHISLTGMASEQGLGYDEEARDVAAQEELSRDDAGEESLIGDGVDREQIVRDLAEEAFEND